MADDTCPGAVPSGAAPRAGAPASSRLPSWWTPALRAGYLALLDELDAQIDATGVVCRVRGLCCDFDRAGHVLLASGIEIAYVREGHEETFPAGSRLCPFWKDGLCTERERRPVGCRTYHCDERFREELEALGESACRRLKELADRHGVPWEYVSFVGRLRGEG